MKLQWPIKFGSDPSDISKIDNAQLKDIKKDTAPSEAAQAEINNVCAEANESSMIEGMTRYLKDKGYNVTPSGTPVKNLFGKIAETGEDAFHVGRGVVRKVKNNITAKVDELKTIGS